MQRELGRTGLRVHPIGLGAMALSLRGRPGERSAIGVIHAALEAGVNFIDTANAYCTDQTEVGHNERLIARALREWRGEPRPLVATKGGMIRPGGAWHIDARPEALRAACEKSLRDLGVETIALYQLHAPDRRVPYADSVGALARLREEGKIRHVGVSNVSEAQLRTAEGIVPVTSVQNRCNPADQEDLRNGLVRRCGEAGITYIPYSPVGGLFGHRDLGRRRLFHELADKHGCSPQRVMLRWLLHHGDHVLPIPGASRAASIADSARAPGLTLDPADVARIDALG